MKSIATLLFFVLLCTSCRFNRQPADLETFSPPNPLNETTNFGEYTINIYREAGGCFFTPSSLEILKNSHRVYGVHGFNFTIYDNNQRGNSFAGADITGDGQPNLVILEWTGGAHGCYIFHILELGQRFRLIQTIDTVYDSAARFENLDDDPALEVSFLDWTFAYWNECYAGSPAPEVILKYFQGQYRMAPKLMKKPPMNPAELHKMAATIRSLPDWTVTESSWDFPVPTELWAEMLPLIYTGNMSQAWELVDLAWPDGCSGKQGFLEEFKAQLATSPFWKDIEAMNACTASAEK